MIDYSSRTMTSFGVSIGTGLMLESLFKPITERYDKDRVIPVEVKIDKYHYHFYNMITLVRNIITSFKDIIAHDVFIKDKRFPDEIMNEINQIASLYENSQCKPILYLPKMDKIIEHFNKGKDREYTLPVKRTLDIYNFLKKINYSDYFLDMDFITDIILLPKVDKKYKSLVTTSYCFDLFTEIPLEVLESHTGVLVNDKDFYKYYNKIGSRDMTVFPFKEILLYYIGDINISCIISPKTRVLLHELAISCKWSDRTTDEKIKDDIRRDETLRAYLKNYSKISRHL